MKTFSVFLALSSAFLGATIAVPACHESWEAPMDYVFPNVHTTGPVNVMFKPHVDNCLHNREALDKPRVLPRPNATNFNIWGFNAVSRNNPNESVAIVFSLATGDGIPGLTAPVSVKAVFSFADGSVEAFDIDAVDSEEGAARLHTEGAGSSGTWGTTGASWRGDFDGANYVVTLDSDTFGIHGTLNMTSIAPSHYPCTAELEKTITLELLPGALGWTNQIPDAKVSAKFSVRSTSTKQTNSLSFDKGSGWHDNTWSDRPWQSLVSKWVFGRASIGAGTLDSINWFQGEDYTGKVHTSAYIARQGKVIRAACETVAKRGQEKLVTIQSGERMTTVGILLADGKTYELEMYKDLQLDNCGKDCSKWSGVAVGGQLRGHGLLGEAASQVG